MIATLLGTLALAQVRTVSLPPIFLPHDTILFQGDSITDMGRGRTAEAQGDIGRVCEIWEECLSRFGHHQFLFGEFSIADAFFAPVVMRFRSYGVSLAPALQAYCERVQAHPAVARWMREALDEPYIAGAHE